MLYADCVYCLIKYPPVFQRLTSQSITPAAYFFQKHFDNAQFESHREDGLWKLRSDAVPMVFDTLPAVMDSRMEHSKPGCCVRSKTIPKTLLFY